MSLRVSGKVDLDGSGFTRTLSGLKGQVTKFSTDIKGQLAGMFAIGAVTAAIKTTLDWAGAMQDMADKTGMSAESIQIFDAAAKEVGQSADAVGASFGKFVGYLEEARTKGGDAAATLQKFGVTGDMIAKQKYDEAFLSFARSLGASEDRAGAMTAAMDALGKKGLDLLLIFGNLEGKKALFSGDEIAALDELGDAFGRLQMRGMQAVGQLMLFLEWGFKKEGQALAVLEEGVKSLFSGNFGNVKNVAGQLLGLVPTVDDGFEARKKAAQAKAAAQREKEAADKQAALDKDKLGKLQNKTFQQNQSNLFAGLNDPQKVAYLIDRIKELRQVAKEPGQDALIVEEARYAYLQKEAELMGLLKQDKPGKGNTFEAFGDSLSKIGGFVGGAGMPQNNIVRVHEQTRDYVRSATEEIKAIRRQFESGL